MTIYQFMGAEEVEQIEAFWQGSFVGSRSNGQFKIECRQINDFYVEYTVLGGHYIGMNVFKNPDLLQPYLSQIDISTLGPF